MKSTSQYHRFSASPANQDTLWGSSWWRVLAVVALMGMGGWLSSSLAQQPQSIRTSLPAPPDDVRVALTVGDTDQAVELLDALQKSSPDSSDVWAFYRGVAFQNAKRWSEAETQFKDFPSAYPNSPWRLQAKYRRAAIAQKTRNFQLAEEIYREAAAHLLSEERQAELAGIYNRLADLMAKPQDPTDPQSPSPRYQQAVELYSKAFALPATDEVRAHAARAMGYSEQHLGRHTPASGHFREYFELVQDEFSDGYWPAQLAHAKSLGLGVSDRAQRRALQDILRTGASRLQDDTVTGKLRNTIQQVVAQAQHGMGDSWKKSGRMPLAISAWERTLEHYPNYLNASDVVVSIATNTQGDEQLAAWDRLLEMRPTQGQLGQLDETELEAFRSKHERLLRYGLFRKGQSLKATGKFADAIRVFADYTRRYPDGANWSDAQQNILKAERSVADRARQQGHFAEARAAYARFLVDHPLNKSVGEIQIAIGATYLEEAAKSKSQKVNNDLFRSAIAQWEQCAASNGTNNTASEALFQIASTLENELLDAGAAVKAYRNVTFGSHQARAVEHLNNMLETRLNIATERTARSNEQVRIKVQTRNIDKLEVHVHALDLESYFRKHHKHTSVEELDLDLIAPEKRFEHAVEDYAQYSPIDFQLEIPVEGPGVWVVSVIGGEKRATTLVLRSDLDLIVKASRHEVFVYAQNMLQGAPAPNVNVLLSVPTETSNKIVSVTTDEHGVAKWLPEGESLQSQRLHALALFGGHVSSTAFNNQNLQLGRSVAPKSVIYVDRPAYRPGETVHWRAIALRASQGSWTTAEDVVSQVRLMGPGGRVYRQGLTALSAMGSLDGLFQLEEDAQPGRWSLHFSGKDLETTTCHFEVETFRMPMAEVNLTTDKDLVWRGDRVAVTAQALTTYGAPLANTRLLWSIPGHGVHEVRTDSDGQAEYILDTQEYGEAQFLTIRASLPTENVHGITRVQLAVSGFHASIKLERKLELAGTTFPVVIATTAPDGSPIGATMTLKVKRNSNPAEGRWKEEQLFEKQITTDAKTGLVTIPLEVATGGNIILTATGRDQFNQRIRTHANLQISGEEDTTKLRLLTKDTSLDLGQEGTVQAVNRGRAGLALLTLESDRVLEYRLVQLNAGSTELIFQSQQSHVPAVNVALAFMDGHRFHESSARFEVRPELNLEIVPDQDTTAPGGSSQITLRATDGSGNPVQGEFSVAAVEEALFQLYPARKLDLAQHFSHAPRSFPSVNTRSTCEFAYRGSTQAIAQGLLEETKRVEREKEWKRARKNLLSGPATPGPTTRGDDWMLGAELMEMEAEVDMDEFNQAIGMGGGSGGKFGSRAGGRGRLSGHGGQSDSEKAGPPDSPTALWVAQVQTNEEGIGTLDVAWPDRSTRWRLTAHGIAAGNRFASATSHVTAQSDFFVELIAPPLLLEGDRPQIQVKIHDAAMLAGTAHVELQVQTRSGPAIHKAHVELGGSAIVEHTFPVLAALGGPQDLQVTVLVAVERGSELIRASSTREIHVDARGWQQIASRSGTLTDQIQLNMDLAGTGRTLELHFGVTLEDDLIRQALGQFRVPMTCRWNGGPVQKASNLISVCAIANHMQNHGGHPAYPDIEDRIHGLVATLLASQKSGGGWAWSGSGTNADAHSTAHVALALSRAEGLGWRLEGNAKRLLTQRLASFVKVSPTTDFELRTHLQHALASLGQSDFAALNRLHRSRGQMSVASKAHLALALVAAERIPLAAEIVSELEAVGNDLSKQRYWKPNKDASWMTSQVETTALVALAMQAVSTPAKGSKKACDFLMSKRPWPNPRTRGFAIWALAQQGLQRLPGQANGFVAVQVAGQEASRVALTSQAGHRHTVLRFDLPDALPGTQQSKVTIDLRMSGNIAPQYTAIVRGHVTENSTANSSPFYVHSRFFLANPTRYEGQLMPAGFGCVVEEKRWKNERSSIEAGEIINLEIEARRRYFKNAPFNGRVEYVEMEVPIPSGLEVFDPRKSGERPYRMMGNSLIFPMGPMNNHRSSQSFSVSLVAAHSGIYAAPEVILRSAYHPEMLALSVASEVHLLPEGERSTDSYRMTPDESFHLAKAHFDDGKLKEVRALLLPLLDEFENKFRPTYLKQVAHMLLFASVESGSPNEIVRYFEIIKQRAPDLFIPIAKVLQIGAAYAELGEHERAMLIFRASLNEAFGKDLQIVGSLDQQNHWLMATRLLDQLIGEYPSLPIVVETDLTLADRVLSEAPVAHERQDLRGAGADRAALTGMGIQRFKRFLSLYPNSPLSADAALNLVAAYFDLEDHQTAAELCDEMTPLHKEPVYQDAFRYSGAVSRWYLGQDDTALAELLAISKASYTRPNLAPIPSPNRDLAKYIMAQIYHARKDVDSAATYYKSIEDQYPDAALALGSMLDQELHIKEEILRVHPGEKVKLTLSHRNLTDAQLLVYPVDLMTLYLREKDLSRVTQVNLAGVSPEYRGTLQLPEGATLRSDEVTTSLPLTEPGAYLVIMRGGSLHASSLILISDIELNVDEFTNGHVRVQVSSHGQDSFLKGVDVRVLGSEDGIFKIGSTDLRGLFSADDVQGKATIIARMDGNHYAFHRGTKSLSSSKRKGRDKGPAAVANPDQAFFFSNVAEFNGANNHFRFEILDKEIQADRKGVQVQTVY
ncbi:MAG: tetratricopeptide repeat protein [bacterium]|nr:tetratricopeptide repeat protein [bacterium]